MPSLPQPSYSVPEIYGSGKSPLPWASPQSFWLPPGCRDPREPLLHSPPWWGLLILLHPKDIRIWSGLMSPHQSPTWLPSCKNLCYFDSHAIQLYGPLPLLTVSSTDSRTTHSVHQGLQYLVHQYPLPFSLKSCHHPGGFQWPCLPLNVSVLHFSHLLPQPHSGPCHHLELIKHHYSIFLS